MRYFLDTEFIEDGRTIELISIGIIREDEGEYYAINKDFDHRKASGWVIENVLEPYIGSINPQTGKFVFKDAIAKQYLKTKEQIAQEVLEFVASESNPEIWADYPSYDWIAFCQLFGTMMDLPNNYPMFCRNFRQLLDDFPDEKLLVQTVNQDHAFYDALWLKEAFDNLSINTSPADPSITFSGEMF